MLQSEIQNKGNLFLTAIKLMIQSEQQSVDHESSSIDLKQLKMEEDRYQDLRLKSLEYLIILENYKKCPKHFVNSHKKP